MRRYDNRRNCLKSLTLNLGLAISVQGEVGKKSRLSSSIIHHGDLEIEKSQQVLLSNGLLFYCLVVH